VVLMNYKEQVKFLRERDSGFAGAVELLKSLRRSSSVVVFSHHDVDGIASAFILQRLCRRLGAKVVVKLPEGFRLLAEELETAVRGTVDLLLISDKGTFASYDDFFRKAENVLILDHHPLDGRPTRCTVFNPAPEYPVGTATALLCHMLATQLGPTDEHDDLVALIGCRGDAVFDPVENRCDDFARPFVERARQLFPRLFRTRLGCPTMYDLVDRRRTALVNQITEAAYAGTLAHYYEAETRGGAYGPELVFTFLNDLARRGENPAEFRSLDDVLGKLPAGAIISRTLQRFYLDWELLSGRVQSPVFLGEVQGVGVYLAFAKEAPSMQSAPFPAILPHVAATQLEPLKRAFGHEETAIIVFCPKEIGVQVSMRGGGGVINCGQFCSRLAERLRRLFPPGTGIEGGGHVAAAEFFAGKSVPIYAVMRELLWMAEELFQQGSGSSGGQEPSVKVME
jgi:hypothetical protein